jgi:hypothetical protein
MLFDDGGVRLFTPAAATATRATTPAATARLIAIKDADTAGAATTQVAAATTIDASIKGGSTRGLVPPASFIGEGGPRPERHHRRHHQRHRNHQEYVPHIVRYLLLSSSWQTP